MTGFSADWLALREPFDLAARRAAAASLGWPSFAARLRARAGSARPIAVLDLGCGTGASLRAIAPRLGGVQHWRLVDHDAALLDAAADALRRWAGVEGLQAEQTPEALSIAGQGLQLHVQFVQADLADPWDDAWWSQTDLVTASALLDLVSAAWLQRLVTRCRAAGAAICWALSVDDRQVWSPTDADDVALAQAFSAHQHRDKGLGPALGGSAAALAVQWLGQAGYSVAQAHSDWLIDGRRGADDQAMLRALAEGMAAAATEQCPGEALRLRGWLARRSAQVAQLGLRLGHVDLLGWPDARP